jgi:TRAP-type C4-dicarboxylate transport system permease small subunit
MEGLERAAQRGARALALGAAALLLGVAILTLADVLLRWIFSAPIRGFLDLITLANAVIVAACLPALLVTRGNVTIRLVGDWLGPRVAFVLDAFGAFLTLVFFALMAWQYVRYSVEMTSAGERMAILKWPVGPWWWTVTAMIVVTVLAALVVLFSSLRSRWTR